jgi:hypothetical protein
VTSRLYVLERDIADDPQPAAGSWEFLGLVKWAMEILSREGTGLFYCERDIRARELVVCFEKNAG